MLGGEVLPMYFLPSLQRSAGHVVSDMRVYGRNHPVLKAMSSPNILSF